MSHEQFYDVVREDQSAVIPRLKKEEAETIARQMGAGYGTAPTKGIYSNQQTQK